MARAPRSVEATGKLGRESTLQAERTLPSPLTPLLLSPVNLGMGVKAELLLPFLVSGCGEQLPREPAGCHCPQLM